MNPVSANRVLTNRFLTTVKNERGQGLIEYLVIVAIVAVGTIAIVRSMGETVTSKFASVTYALQGKTKRITPEIDESTYQKKDLSNFFNGAGDRQGSGGQ